MAIDIVGRGWTFPVGFDSRTGGINRDSAVSVSQRVQRLNEAMAHLLGVEVGEVFFNRRFGADLRNLVFRPNDLTLHTQIEFVITQAIETFKKTVIIRLIGVEPDPDDRTRVNVSLTYAIRRTNVVGNFVFPLYLRQLARLAGESSLRQ